MDVVQVRDGAIVLPGIEHGQVHQLAELEGSPDSETVIHLDLTVQHLATCVQRKGTQTDSLSRWYTNSRGHV